MISATLEFSMLRSPLCMHFRLSLILALLVFAFVVRAGSVSDSISKLEYPWYSNDQGLEQKITVRESTTELQIRVGEAIFVFGKAKGTLDKVKVGMHVLPFAQVPAPESSSSKFNKVSWKQLKDGSIQIQSSYQPWPATLTWTVFSNGQLKMEATAPSGGITSAGWLGLGFNIADKALHQVSWETGHSNPAGNPGVWKNSSFLEMADPEQEMSAESNGFFQLIQKVKMEFESVTVEIRSDSPGVFLGLGQPENQDSNPPKFNSDLAFLFNPQLPKANTQPQTPSENTSHEPTVALNPLVLWFHFQ